MIKSILIPEDIVNELQKADAEMSSRREIITYILTKDINVATNKFNQYQSEYCQYYFAFEKIKYKIETEFVDTALDPNEIKQKWNLNYLTKELQITYTIKDDI